MRPNCFSNAMFFTFTTLLFIDWIDFYNLCMSLSYLHICFYIAIRNTVMNGGYSFSAVYFLYQFIYFTRLYFKCFLQFFSQTEIACFHHGPNLSVFGWEHCNYWHRCWVLLFSISTSRPPVQEPDALTGGGTEDARNVRVVRVWLQETFCSR